MKRVIYLNYDLDNPTDLACYQILESLGRSKKQVVNMLLKNAGLCSSTSSSKETVPEVKHPVDKRTSMTEQKGKKQKPVIQMDKEVVPEKGPEEIVIKDATVPTFPNQSPPAPTLVTPTYQEPQQHIQTPTTQQMTIQEPEKQDDGISEEEAAMMSQLGNMFQSMQS